MWSSLVWRAPILGKGTFLIWAGPFGAPAPDVAGLVPSNFASHHPLCPAGFEHLAERVHRRTAAAAAAAGHLPY